MTICDRKTYSLSAPSLNHEELEACQEALENGWLSRGPLTEKFEKELSVFTGSPYTLATSSCTAAIHLALLALELKEGDAVLLPAITYVSTLHTLLQMRLKPILVDVEAQTLNISLRDLEKKVDTNCRVLITTDMAGIPCDYKNIQAFCRERALFLIQDAAHSIGSTYKNQPVGSFADATCFSFYPTKSLASAEGGALCTPHLDIYKKTFFLHQQGIAQGAWNREYKNKLTHWEVISPGYKYNCTDLQANIARVQLKKLPEHKKKRTALVRYYTEVLSTIKELSLPCFSESVCFYIYPIQIKTLNRDSFAQALMDAGIGIGFHFLPLHWHPYFKENLPTPLQLPQAEEAGRRLLSLPLHPQLNFEEIKKIKKIIIKTIAELNKNW
tara:strand:- start:2471 stop:3625 length:1155 start_codon:yes stop_codon:yes gene_type:complete